MHIFQRHKDLALLQQKRAQHRRRMDIDSASLCLFLAYQREINKQIKATPPQSTEQR